ncbi:hypothetical protein PCASD_03195 [Puccinia coronata f. sp. avenae]|uniref:DNA-directed DNA polymerase n=1 Tax=Puccinia coronata f. sp. avenae TaxID=200324 RepID=A0A2N5VFH4_9BASI|nr:hypothetical protein PCASD_03195 [Puccinia coronata f. sp. avenae]
MMMMTTRITQQYDPLETLRNEYVIPFKARSYAQQFANVYFLRLSRLRERLTATCRRRWPAHPPARVLDIDPSKISVVIGTLYCEMKLKPNVLEDLAREHHLGPALGPRKWVSEDDDAIMLEDESGRIRLVGVDRQKYTLVTGIIIGVKGQETTKGDFQVHEIVYAGVPPQPKSPLLSTAQEGSQGLVAIVSGLDLNSTSPSRANARAEMLVQWLNGEVGGEEERGLARSVGRLVIAGNLTRVPSAAETTTTNGQSKEPMGKLKRSGYEPVLPAASTMDRADQLLSQLAVPLDLMPGPNDPTIQSLPQQALHRCLFPKASALESPPLNGPNPWWAEIGGATFLGTSGQNLDDIYKYVGHEDRLKLATEMLEWSHIAPTAPDTLHCYPFRERDPFVLSRLPHVYFIGNQPQFETRVVEHGPAENRSKTRVVLVPRFSRSPVVVLVDPVSLQCHSLLLLPSLPSDDPSHPDGLDTDEQEDVQLPEKLVLDIDAADDDDD